MINLNNITLVAIDGTERGTNSLKALKYSSQDINFKDVIFFSPKNYSNESFYKFIEIPFFGYDEYSKFCLIELEKYIESEYVLIIQDDGFVINPSFWRDEYLKYDYIGAPWKKEHLFYNTKRWPNIHKKLIQSDINYHIGNGGFTLRSKKLLNHVKNLYKEEYYAIPEDVVICIGMREELELKGNVFAPLDVARTFSCESLCVEGVFTNTHSTFGFHGRDVHTIADIARLNNVSLI